MFDRTGRHDQHLLLAQDVGHIDDGGIGLYGVVYGDVAADVLHVLRLDVYDGFEVARIGQALDTLLDELRFDLRLPIGRTARVDQGHGLPLAFSGRRACANADQHGEPPRTQDTASELRQLHHSVSPTFLAKVLGLPRAVSSPQISDHAR